MADLQPLLDAVPSNSTIVLDPGTTYTIANPITKPVTLQTRTPLSPTARAAAGDVTITTTGGLFTQAPITLTGISVKCSDPLRNIIQVQAPGFVLDRSAVLGTTTAGARRGIAVNASGGRILNSTIDQCWRPDTEGQAILGWDGTEDWEITNCYLGGASQSLMFGGADASSASRVPRNIRVSRCDLGKDPAWTGHVVLKTSFELKTGIGVHLSDCTFDGAGTGQGQGAYVMVLKSCNQDGSAPWSQTQGVTIERFTAMHGGGAVNFVANDGSNPSVTMGNVTLRNGTFSAIDPTLYPGSPGRGYTFIGAMTDVTLENLILTGANLAASMYFIAPFPKRLVLRNLQLPQSTYGVKIENSGLPPLMTPAAIVTGIKSVMPDAIVEGITVV